MDKSSFNNFFAGCKLNHGSLFSGIGGFDLASEWMGWTNVFHCEINPFGRKILNYYWPKAIQYEDITKTDFSIHRGQIDILTGGFPCQPYSNAGSRKGKDDERNLWPNMLEAIRQIKPKWIVGENVPGLISWSNGLVFEEIQSELETEGYKIQPIILPAISVGAYHLRERIWVVAYSGRLGWEDVQSHFGSRFETIRNPKRNSKANEWGQKETNELDTPRNTFLQFQQMYSESPIFNVDDGIPFELDGITIPKYLEESNKAAGNAIVPQVAYQIFKTIEQIEVMEKIIKTDLKNRASSYAKT